MKNVSNLQKLKNSSLKKQALCGFFLLFKFETFDNVKCKLGMNLFVFEQTANSRYLLSFFFEYLA